MAGTQGAQTLFDVEDLGVGTHYRWCWALRADRLRFEWDLRDAAAASPAASITIFSTASTEERRLTAPLDDTNRLWVDETPKGAVFTSVPATTAGARDYLPLGGNCATAYMIKLTVLSALSGFSLRVNGVG